ncbi:MAG: hypothetical protein BWK78_03260 [Thiotrichaceae bacterium IS1]|nr:MAG: hypothetical protein BWK78_03260 [Thiotrichaceae bacterium IS1]
MILSVNAFATSDDSPGSVKRRTHFIIVIRDTKTMAESAKYDRIGTTLPSLLFSGKNSEYLQEEDTSKLNLPVYSHGDYISVVFASILKNSQTRSPSCRDYPNFSVAPEKLFFWQFFKTFENEVAFRNSLTPAMSGRQCHGDDLLFPVTVVQQTILPYLQTKLTKLSQENKSEVMFSDTILIVVNNDIPTGIGNEEAALLKYEVAEIDEAKLSIDQFQNSFDWELKQIFTVDTSTTEIRLGYVLKDAKGGGKDNPVTYVFYNLKPKVNVDSYIDYKPEIQLDRLAISKEKLRLIDERSGNRPELVIKSDALVIPETLRITNVTGRPWQLGNFTFSSLKPISLTDCTPPCVQPLLETMMNAAEIYLTPDDKPLKPGKIQFQVRFRYDAKGVYTHSYIDSEEKTVQIQPVETITIQESDTFPKMVLDNTTLATLFDKSKDTATTGLTQGKAQDRILAEREVTRVGEKAKKALEEQLTRLYLFMAAVVIVILISAFLFKRFYRRHFQPRLDWQPAEKVVIDFNQQPGARLLVGTVTVKNEGKLPWFGQLFGNKDYPDYTVDFSVNYSNDDLEQRGFFLKGEVPLGFMRTSAGVFTQENQSSVEEAQLERKTLYRVSHDTPVYLFLATEIIEDFVSTQPGDNSVDFGKEENPQITIVMKWDNGATSITRLSFTIDLTPERSKPPQVTYTSNCTKKTVKCYFNQGEAISIGLLKFISQAAHKFSESFEDSFKLLSYRDHLPLLEGTIFMDKGEQVMVPPFETVEVVVKVQCDGVTVQNPEPSQGYSFDLIGEFVPASKREDYQFTLYRDPNPADIDLEISQFRTIYRLFWEPSNPHPICKQGRDGSFEATGQRLEGDQLILQQPCFIPFRKGTPASSLFKIRVGNTGRSGRGQVKVNLEMSLQPKGNVQDSLRFQKGRCIRDLLQVSGCLTGPVDDKPLTITVTEGELAKEELSVEIRTDPLEGIQGGRVDSNQIDVEVTLDIEVRDDAGQERRHHLLVRAGMGLEQLPNNEWICIDFGTSAIAVAVGTVEDKSGSMDYHFLHLQKLVEEENPYLNIADFDKANSEVETNFLPSYILCDADDRRGDERARKGFPRSKPSLKPGDPNFITLPAIANDLTEKPKRVIYSLKSWLGQLSDFIVLPEPMTFELDGREVTRNQLRLEAVVQSGLAALAEAYITYFNRRDNVENGLFEPGGQVVLSCPNTFTAFHRQKLQDIAYKALTGPLGIVMRKHIHLISESDAVAYHHCQQRLTQGKYRTGTERLVVYDFGAGTLDLSLVKVTWGGSGTYPEQWQVENRLGVPIAGNYVDSQLARLIDRLLRDNSVLAGLFEYQYPVVGDNLTGNTTEQDNYRTAVYRLWEAIRTTKLYGWKGKQSFRVQVGSSGKTGIVRKKDSSEMPTGNADSEVPHLTVAGEDYYLSIPTSMVHNHLQDFVEFATDTVIDELLAGAGVMTSQVDTVIVSGRGALWPGLRGRVWDKFPHIPNDDRGAKPDFLTLSQEAKNVVVSGALAWQQLSRQKGQPLEVQMKPRLAVLRVQTQQLTLEDEWEDGNKPIDLNADSTFRLVQVSLKNPQPKEDFKSLKHYFYIDVGEAVSRDLRWADDPRLYVVRKTEQDGHLTVHFENSRGEHSNPMEAESVSSTMLPPWPIGKILLEPEPRKNHR